jgi:hypothetical protein
MREYAKKMITYLPTRNQAITLTIMITIVLTGLLGSFTVFSYNVELDMLGGKTIVERIHGHPKRYINFNHNTDLAQNTAISDLKGYVDIERELQRIKMQYRDHEDKLYDLVDDNGNFTSDFKRKMWERRDNEFLKSINKLEDKIKGETSSFTSSMMIAKRER